MYAQNVELMIAYEDALAGAIFSNVNIDQMYGGKYNGFFFKHLLLFNFN